MFRSRWYCLQYVSLNRLPEKRHSHIGCICWTFLHCGDEDDVSKQMALPAMWRWKMHVMIHIHVLPLHNAYHGLQCIKNAKICFLGQSKIYGVNSLVSEHGWDVTCVCIQMYFIASVFHIWKPLCIYTDSRLSLVVVHAYFKYILSQSDLYSIWNLYCRAQSSLCT